MYDDRRNNSLLFQGEVPVGARGELQLQAGYSRGDYQAESIDQYAPGFRRNFPATNNFQSLQWRQHFTDDDEWLTTLSHAVSYQGDPGFSDNSLIPGVILNVEYQAKEERYEADLQYSRRLSDQWRVVTGLGYYDERLWSPYYFNTDATLEGYVARVFGHGEYRPRDDLVINAGAMLESSKLSGNGLKWLFLPRLSINFHLNDHHTVRAVYSTGARQPNLYENQGRAVVRGVNVPLTLYRAYATGIDQGGLAPEINRSYELGYLWQPSRRTSFDLRLFQENITNFIGPFYRKETRFPTVLPGHLVLDAGNDNPITLRGVEAQFDWHHEAGTRLFTNYALLNIDAAGTRFNYGYEQSAPQHAVNLLVSQDIGNGWQASLTYHYQSGMAWYMEVPINAYHQLSARLAKTFKLGNAYATAELVGTNLVGSVSNYLPTRAWERGVFIRFTLDY